MCQAAADPALTFPCLYQAGDHECPAGFAKQPTLYQGVDDTRECAACDCATPAGGACGGTVQLYPTSCNVGAIQAMLEPNCNISLASGFAYAKYVPGLVSPGTCAATGGQPQGTLAEADPVTVCCAD